MTPAQNKTYWRLWGRVRKALVELGDFSKEDADAERHLIHERALGKPKSSTKFNKTTDVDKVFKAFEDYLVIFDGPTKGNRAVDQPRLRLIYAIDQLALGDAYVAKISTDQFGTADWRGLPEQKLTWLRFTCTSRAGKKAPAAFDPQVPCKDPF